jgi:hypothetical protein
MKKNFTQFTTPKSHFFSLAVRFKNLLRRVEKLISSNEFWSFSQKKQSSLLGKLSRLYQQVSSFSTSYALKIAGASICFTLFCGSVNAADPTFSKWVSDIPIEFSSIYSNLTSNNSTDYTFMDGSFADIDGDGDLDATLLALITGSGQELFYFENDNGIFSQNTIDSPFGNLTSLGDVYNIDIADYDNDGDLDLITCEALSGTFITHYQLNSGTFEFASGSDINDNHYNAFASSEIDPSTSENYLSNVKFMDVDNDGLSDLVGTYNASGSTISRTIYQQSDNTFSNTTDNVPIDVSINNSSSSAILQIADMDNDGDDDMFVFYGSSSFSDCNYYQNDGSGNFTLFDASSDIPLPLSDMSNDGYTFLADLDGDTDIDVFQPGDVLTTANQASFENTSDSTPAVPVSPFVALLAFIPALYEATKKYFKKKIV